MTTWTLRIRTIAPSGNVILRMHHNVYGRLLALWFGLIRGSEAFLDIPRARGRRKVTVIRHSRGKLDQDNLEFSAKPIFDVLRPARTDEGVYKTGKRKDEPWIRRRIGHGLIVEDDPAHVVRVVLNGKLEKGEKPYTTIIIEEATA